jgi:hypothetical protein
MEPSWRKGWCGWESVREIRSIFGESLSPSPISDLSSDSDHATICNYVKQIWYWNLESPTLTSDLALGIHVHPLSCLCLFEFESQLRIRVKCLFWSGMEIWKLSLHQFNGRRERSTSIIKALNFHLIPSPDPDPDPDWQGKSTYSKTRIIWIWNGWIWCE